MKLTAISQEALNTALMSKDFSQVDYRNHFAAVIEQATLYAPGPFCWFIPETKNMTIMEASDNMHQVTPHAAATWTGKGLGFWFSTIHPADVDFVMAGVAMAAKMNETPPVEKSNKLNSNIYCRMLDANKKHRWVLIQFPQRLYNGEGKVISCVVMITDLSHLAVTLTTMMTVVDVSNNESHYYTVVVNEQKLADAHLPVISKREREVLQLMARGLNSPQIAKQLFIAYHTVENHKRNLRKKTSTKTAAALINFAWENNLL